MSYKFIRLLAYVITSHHANLSKMSKHWGSFLTHCKYSVSVLRGQPDRQCNIGWQCCRIRRTLTEYSVSVASSQPDTQSNPCCQSWRNLKKYTVGFGTDHP